MLMRLFASFQQCLNLLVVRRICSGSISVVEIPESFNKFFVAVPIIREGLLEVLRICIHPKIGHASVHYDYHVSK